MMQVWKLLIVLYTNEEGMGITENMALELCLELSLVIFFWSLYQWPAVGGLGTTKVIAEMFLKQIELETAAMSMKRQW